MALKRVERTIVMVGLKHSGKTSVGSRLAELLALPFFDLDDEIVQRYRIRTGQNVTIREIYRFEGPEAFLQLETTASRMLIDRIRGETRAVISLGGGTVDNPEAFGLWMTEGLVVFLDEEEDVLYGRIVEMGLPAFLDPADPRSAFRAMYARRRNAYLKQADIVIPAAGRNIDLITDEVLASLEGPWNGRQ